MTTVINSRTEKTKAAQLSAVQAKDAELSVQEKRIALRDEQLANCERDRAQLQAQLDTRNRMWPSR